VALKWSPHPRYRIYTGGASYTLPLRQILRHPPDAARELENEICRRFDVSAACCVPMARTGLYFGLRELIEPGQKVILSPLTIVDVVNMVLLAGGIPVFADIRRQSCTIDPDQTEDLIDGQTGAVLITHLHGETAGAHDFRDLCNRRGVPLIEDAAQAFGAIENGSRLGAIGHLGIYSFGFYKNLNAWRGGMVVSQDYGLIARIRQRMDDLPRLPTGRLLALAVRGLLIDAVTWPPVFASVTHPILRQCILHGMHAVHNQLDPEHGAGRLSAMPSGYLYRMAPSQQTLALKQLACVDADSRVRIAKAALYSRALAPIENLILPQWHGRDSNIYTHYPVQCREREAVLRYGMQRGRDFAAQYLRNCADLPEFREFHRDCPNARAAARELILLPTYPRYPESEIQQNIELIQQFFQMAPS
jgi:perosamine synthetase